MTVSRDGETIAPESTVTPYVGTVSETYDFYIVKPGDVITVDEAGEAKGGVKAGYDIRSKVVDPEGVGTHPLDVTFDSLPATYTVTENDVYIHVSNVRS